jgi:hypothetical protein
MRAECKAFAHQLERTFPQAIEAGCSFRVKSNAHEFGSYLEVQVRFDDDDEHQTHWAFMIENDFPKPGTIKPGPSWPLPGIWPFPGPSSGA